MITIKEIRGGTFQNKKELSQTLQYVNTLLETNYFKEEFFSTVFDKFIVDTRVYEDITTKHIPINIEFYSSKRKKDSEYFYGSRSIKINRDIWDSNSTHKKANTLIYEYMRTLGYEHKGRKDLSSVPYTVGLLVQKLIKSRGDEILAGYDRYCYRPWWMLFLVKNCYWSRD